MVATIPTDKPRTKATVAHRPKVATRRLSMSSSTVSSSTLHSKAMGKAHHSINKVDTRHRATLNSRKGTDTGINSSISHKDTGASHKVDMGAKIAMGRRPTSNHTTRVLQASTPLHKPLPIPLTAPAPIQVPLAPVNILVVLAELMATGVS